MANKAPLNIWNELTEEVVEAGTITTLKRHLDRFMDGLRHMG